MKQATRQRVLVSINSLQAIVIWKYHRWKDLVDFVWCLGWLEYDPSAEFHKVSSHLTEGPTRRWEAQSEHSYFSHGYGLPWTASDSYGNTTEEVCNEASNWCLATTIQPYPARTRKVSIWKIWNDVELTKKCIMAWIFALLEYHGAESGWTWQESHLERVWYRQQTMSCLQIRKTGTSCREVDARSHARPKKPGDLWWFRDISTHSYLDFCFFFLRFLLYCLLGGKVWYINCSSPGRGADLAATQRCPWALREPNLSAFGRKCQSSFRSVWRL